MKINRRFLKEESNNPFDVFYSHFKNKIKGWSTMAGAKDIYNWLIDELKELSNISNIRNYNYDFSAGYDTIAKELIKRAKKDFEWLHESIKENLADDIDLLEKSINNMKIGDSVTVKNYKNGDIYKFVKLSNSSTIAAFKNINGVNHIASPQQVFGWAKDSLIYANFKPQFNYNESVRDMNKLNNKNKVLYVIKDSYGNQLSAPSEDDYELWDRVAAMEARGKRGLRVVVYSIKPDKNESLNEVKDDKGVDRYGINGKWWYFTTHGIGPGSVPIGIEILDIIDTPNGSFFCSDRVLNTSELKWYDIKERVPKGVNEGLLDHPYDKYYIDFLSKNKDLFKDLKKLVSNDCKEVWDSYYNFIETFRAWAGKALDNDSLLAESLNEDTINKQFRKDIKRKYKDNQFINSVNKEKRDDTMSMAREKGLDKDPEMRKIIKDYADDKYPLKPFKYDFPKYLEKNDFPFYVTYYQEYPIYEPAEGGYYYPGRDAIYSKGFDTKEEAEAHVEELKNEDGEGGWEKYSNGYIREGKYVGDAEEIVIETRKTYLSQEKGWEPYQ